MLVSWSLLLRNRKLTFHPGVGQHPRNRATPQHVQYADAW